MQNVKNMLKRLLIAVAALAGCCVLLPASGAEQRTFRYAFEVAETGFDPAQITDIYSRYLIANIFDAPLRYVYSSKTGAIEPNTLSAMPEASSDFRTFTFHLKPGIYFTDDPAFQGKRRELVAADYVYSFKRFYDPHWKSSEYGELEPLQIAGLEALRDNAIKSGRFDYDKVLDDVQVLDRYTWRIKLGNPAPRFAYLWADSANCVALAREVVEHYGDAIMEHPVGTGPFRLTEWIRSSHLVLEKNPGYREDIFHADLTTGTERMRQDAKRHDGQRMPFVDRVEVSIIEESQPRWLSFLNAEVDYLERIPTDLAPLAMPNNQLAPNLKRRGITVQRASNIDVTLMLFNLDDPVFGGYDAEHVALRRAIGLGLNTRELIRSLYKMEAIPAQSVIAPELTGYDVELHSEMGDYDPARANAILDTFGYLRKPGDRYRSRPDGSALVLNYSTTPDQRIRLSDEIVKKSMDAIGVQMTFKIAKWPEQLKAARAGRFQAWMLGDSATSPDPDNLLRMAYGPATGGDNLSRFRLAEYDRLYAKQDRLPDGPERLTTLRSMQELLIAYEPMKFTTHRIGIYLAQPWVHNIHWQPFLRDWWRYVDVDPGASHTRT
jgi:ABC-type transport system substrate-binding protein